MLTDTENKLIKNALDQQRRLRDRLQTVDATSLSQEQLVDYTFCVNKNFLAIKNLRSSLVASIIEKMRQNEDEIRSGIENLRKLIDKVNEQADLLGVIDRIIGIIIRIVSIFSPSLSPS